MSDSGSICNTPRSSVLFDPTLTGLDGDMWATQLLTLNTATSISITFNFDGVAIYMGVGTIEVILFTCSVRGIGVTSISIRGDGQILVLLVIFLNLVSIWSEHVYLMDLQLQNQYYL